MKIQEQIDADLKEAMKARDADRLQVLRMIKSSLKYRAIEKGGADASLEDEEAVQVIRKQIKQREESAESYDQANRPELASKERSEAEMLSAYLPQALSAGELENLVRDAIAEAGATEIKQMGAVMKLATARAAGRVDGKTLSAEVKRLLTT